ncbi:hypothetical protein [Paenibacillus barengoltzii]|jgi:hypothetical protein|uniref:hypothetical protein n=1 Tax=Paenibacillus barengoltzii TaxID=343517 RepID=UPI000A08F906|nr:hypothetical protein [Paenibacillus barengoltzii]SMF61043.1 hypothetical protein SAMN02744102_04208 [Paenibacillus barengoltzii]
MPEATCTYYAGNHQMRPQGFAFLCDEDYNRIHWEVTPGLYKCKCGDRFICEGSPEAGTVIGKYVTEGAILGAAVLQGVGVLRIDSKYIHETTARTLDGFTFLP